MRVIRIPLSSYYVMFWSINVTEVDVDRLQACPSLEIVDLEENPLTNPIRSALEKVSSIKITFSLPEGVEDWDDLNG